MTSPLERAARSLYRSAPHDYDPNQMGEDATWPDLVDQASAVLTAIREPSEGMLEAGGNVEWWETIGDNGETVETSLSKGDVPRVWTAMIDAALSEGG